MSGSGICSESMVKNLAQLAWATLPQDFYDGWSKEGLKQAREIAWEVVCEDGAHLRTFESISREVADRLIKELKPDEKLNELTKPVAAHGGFAAKMFRS